jgi:hypothetical protein
VERIPPRKGEEADFDSAVSAVKGNFTRREIHQPPASSYEMERFALAAFEVLVDAVNFHYEFKG